LTRVMTVVGTRPEIIRLSRVVSRLDDTLDHVLVHTGQNWDPMLSDVFFDELALRKPDRFLNVDTSSLATVLGGVLVGTEEAIRDYRPDALLVLGDTNSCIAALMARRMRVPVYHLEAGNRCFDLNVPEETNRRMVDHISDFNLVYTEHARRNLLAEGLHPRRIMHTGSPMLEVLTHYRAQIDASDVLSDLGLEPGGYFLVSLHREENVDHPGRLEKLLRLLIRLEADAGVPVLVSTHPRMRKVLESRSGGSADVRKIRFHRPFGFFDYVRLQMKARCTISDSGTISEESALLGFPAVTVRDAMERPEALDTGSIVMACPDTGDLREAIAIATGRDRGARRIPVDYQVPDVSSAVVGFVVSTVGLHHRWDGIRPLTAVE
jgi:UDP-N-acetylglucosamine 2-epimerase